ncbi:MAG TPA: YaiO family outer membrane beta-barrel protein [Gemmatimonadales bacterium]|nr:YaiO family outer membrane beta-barrel protein [Gemmatimonadales bacterium]
MTPAGWRANGWASAGLAGVLAAAAPARLPAQALHVTAWAGYESVTDARDWSTLGGRLAAMSRRGDGAWIAVERLGRFGAEDVTARLGGVLRPGPRWWLTVEAATALDPDFAPRNAWETDLSVLLVRGAGVGMGYRRQNYLPGAVDILVPHASIEAGGWSWDALVFVSRNPSDRTDLAVLVRAAVPLGRRGGVWLGGGAGRESYVVGTPPLQRVASLETVTGIAGVRYRAGNGISVRLDATVVRSRPVLSRRGIAVAVEASL